MLGLLLHSAAGRTIFDESERLQRMLDVESALAYAQAEVGLTPASAAETIAACCRAELFDRNSIADGANLSGNLAIPMVEQLTSLVRARDPEAAGFVHLGATSQDIIDTGMVLQLRSELDLIDSALSDLADALAMLTRSHRSAPMVGRTWLQHAVPITFGLKTAGWLDAVLRHRERMRELKPRVLVLQFGGAAGTLASLGDAGFEVAQALARNLNLGSPQIPWHANRDRVAEVAAFHGLVMGTLGKMARDLSLMMQTEVGEVFEPGGGGSSTMPHKRNPVAAAAILSSALRMPGLVSSALSAMMQEHERGLGGWHAEWELLPEICTLTLGALEQICTMLRGLEVFPVAMYANLNRTRGLVMAEAVSMKLAKALGKMQAHRLVEAASKRALRDSRDLREVLESDPEVTRHLNPAKLESLFLPANYTGATQSMIDQVLAAYETSVSKRSEN